MGAEILSKIDTTYSQLGLWFGLWMGFLALLFLRAEVLSINEKLLSKSGKPLEKVSNDEETSKQRNLPEFNWNDITLRVAKGSFWMVIHDVIYVWL
jgi:hypothetical protein